MTSTGALVLGMRMTLGVVIGVVLLLSSAAPADANGVHVGSREVFAGEVGAYRLTVSTTPVTGPMHFIIFLATAGEETAVADPAITMQGAFTGDGGLDVGPVEGYGTLEGPLWYAADLPIETAGLWEFTLTVDSALGSERATFAVPVVEAGGASLTLIALIVVALGIFGFTLGNRMFGRRRRARGRRPQS
ncbi:MAG: hypothetical protein OXC99_02385 [Chloroflexi bacterium]|nr:hypothetical protein [Chloroflexota bacterium]